MLSLLLLCVFTRWADAALHHFFVGTVNGGSVYMLELDDVAKTLTPLKNMTAAGASPSIAFDHSNKYLFGTRPSDGTVSRYLIGEDYTLQLEGTGDIPSSCNTTTFQSIKITSGTQSPYEMYGVASTGTCSTVFSLSLTGFRTLKSKEIAGDVHSFAWSPNGEHLHALDSTANSILNYYISGTPDLESLQATDIVTNATKIRQIITHPVGHRMYVVTQTTNELIDIPLRTDELLEKNTTQTRAYVLPKSYSSDAWVTTSLAISASNATLWTLTQSKAPDSTFIVTVFRLDPVTGAVLKPVARSSFKNYIGDGTSATSLLTPGPTIADGTDLVSFTTYPGAMTAVLGLTQRDGTWGIAAYGRALLTQDEGCCGEGAWVD